MLWTIVTLIGWKQSKQELQLQLQLLREIHALLFECGINRLHERQHYLKEAGEEGFPLCLFDCPPALIFLRKLVCVILLRGQIQSFTNQATVTLVTGVSKKEQVHIERHTFFFFFLTYLYESKTELLSWYSLQPAKIYRSCINHSKGNFPYICHQVSQYWEPLFASFQ